MIMTVAALWKNEERETLRDRKRERYEANKKKGERGRWERGEGEGGRETEEEDKNGTLRLVGRIVVLRQIIMLGKKINLFTRCQICISGLSPRPHGVLSES